MSLSRAAAVGPAYTYAAMVIAVHDGDTITVSIDLGLHVMLFGQQVRLLGCNARELGMPGGLEAREHLRALLPLPPATVTIRTVKPDKFGGRYDAALTLVDGSDLVSRLVAEGWAAAWDGQGPKPVPPWPRIAP
jgi:endonuclease YncB( thermonuclease family)